MAEAKVPVPRSGGSDRKGQLGGQGRGLVPLQWRERKRSDMRTMGRVSEGRVFQLPTAA